MLRRNTNQRQIVYDSLHFLGHASSENLIQYIQSNYSNISLATIYRNLGILLEENMVKKVKLQGIDVYETVKENHYHYVCKHCGKILDVSPEEMGISLPKFELKNGDKVENYEFSFYGLCHECQKTINKEGD